MEAEIGLIIMALRRMQSRYAKHFLEASQGGYDLG